MPSFCAQQGSLITQKTPGEGEIQTLARLDAGPDVGTLNSSSSVNLGPVLSDQIYCKKMLKTGGKPCLPDVFSCDLP